MFPFDDVIMVCGNAISYLYPMQSLGVQLNSVIEIGPGDIVVNRILAHYLNYVRPAKYFSYDKLGWIY